MTALDAFHGAVAHAAAALNRAGILVVLPALMLVVTAEVVVRYGFGGSIRGSIEVAQLLLLMFFFLCLPHCSLHGGHVHMELVHGRMRGTTRRVADAAAALAGLGVAAAFTWQAWDQTAEMYRYGDGGEQIAIDYWPFSAGLVLCGALTALAFLSRLLRPGAAEAPADA